VTRRRPEGSWPRQTTRLPAKRPARRIRMVPGVMLSRSLATPTRLLFLRGGLTSTVGYAFDVITRNLPLFLPPMGFCLGAAVAFFVEGLAALFLTAQRPCGGGRGRRWRRRCGRGDDGSDAGTCVRAAERHEGTRCKYNPPNGGRGTAADEAHTLLW
jgi:hypothetical protein